MRRSLLAVAVAAVFAATACFAQDGAAPSGTAGWAPLFRTASVTTWLDTTRITPSGDRTQIWFRVEPADPQPSPPEEGGGLFEWMDLRITLDCAGRGYVVHQKRTLMDGREVHSEELPGVEKPFSGDGFGSTMRLLCRVVQARGQGQMKAEIDRLYQVFEDRSDTTP